MATPTSPEQGTSVPRPALMRDLSAFIKTHRGVMRIAAAVALAVLAVGSAILGDWVLAVWIFMFVVMTASEWHGIAYGGVRSLDFGLHLGGGAVVLALAAEGATGPAVQGAGITAVVCGAAARYARRDPLWAMAGVLYTLLPGIALIWLRAEAVPGAVTLIWLFAVVWMTDLGALYVGRAVGGPKLSPKLSPKKTWAGLAGGMTAAGAVGGLAGFLVPGASPLVLAALSAVLAIVGQVGDLTESAFKRRFGVKDSGFLIPGQGGVLDRVDGLIFVAVAVALLAWAGEGRVLTLGAAQ